jgi:AcrR family transcriptional regulator
VVQKSDDLRVQRTHALLRQALFDLTVEKGFTAVSVSDITKRARVNRSTFYRHYVDKHDLLDQYLDDVQAFTSEAAFLAEKAAQSTPEKVPQGLLVLIQHVQAYAAFYRVMLGQNGDARFTRRFRRLSEDRYRVLFDRMGTTTAPGVPPVEMRLHYISCAGIGAILWWLESDQPCTAEQLAVWLMQLTMNSAGLALPLAEVFAR